VAFQAVLQKSLAATRYSRFQASRRVGLKAAVKAWQRVAVMLER
jgi:hypothetical protein